VVQRSFFGVPVIAGSLCAQLQAQCTQQWLPGLPRPGVTEFVSDLCMWDRDGAGPEPPVMVMAGAFVYVGTAGSRGVAYWDGLTWQPMARGFYDGSVAALAVLPDGQLVVGGSFTYTADGILVNRIARWSGTNWVPLGAV
jgi:hypothetical protein